METCTFKHTARIDVRYAETDQMGIVHHAVYAVWFEQARTEYFREAGASYADMEAAQKGSGDAWYAAEEGVIYHTAYTMEGRTIFSEGEATYGLSLTAGIALYYTYLELAYAPLRDFVSDAEQHDYECSNFYASEAGTLELDAKTQGASYALSFASYSPKRVNYKNFTEEGETAKAGIIQYSYAVKSLAHPTVPSPEE